ncbi:MAG: hypothetical protein ACKVU4_13470 [Phycisphaerales bacterium]
MVHSIPTTPAHGAGAPPAIAPPTFQWEHAPSLGGLAEEQRSFAAVLARGQSANTMTPQAKAREAAMQLVAVALVQPILKELRDTNSAAPPFAPTQGEQQFRALMDAELAQRVVQAARFPLVDRLAQELLDRAERANPTTPEPGAMSGAETGA